MARDDQLNLRLSAAERRAMARAAKRAGLALSEWVRLVAVAAAGRCPVCGGTWDPNRDPGVTHSPAAIPPPPNSPDDSDT